MDGQTDKQIKQSHYPFHQCRKALGTRLKGKSFDKGVDWIELVKVVNGASFFGYHPNKHGYLVETHRGGFLFSTLSISFCLSWIFKSFFIFITF